MVVSARGKYIYISAVHTIVACRFRHCEAKVHPKKKKLRVWEKAAPEINIGKDG